MVKHDTKLTTYFVVNYHFAKIMKNEIIHKENNHLFHNFDTFD